MKKLLQSVALSVLLLGASVAPTVVLAQAAPKAAPAIERLENGHVLAIEGVSNFRDLGGYKTVDGHTTRPGLVFRSSEMSHVTPQGFAQLKSLGLRTNVDLRSTDERTKQPIAWPADMGVKVHQVDYPMDMAPFMALFSKGNVTAEDTRGLMTGFYKDLPFTFAPQYGNLVRQIIDDKAPVVFNCSAGKDRTGFGAAVILTLVGVPRETVTKDYLLSNTYYRPVVRPGEDDAASAMYKRLSPEVVQALMGVDARYLESAFAAIDAREGGWQGYVEKDLRLTPADIAKLKAKLLL